MKKNKQIVLFSKEKADLITLANRYKKHSIIGIEDTAGYKQVHQSRMHLGKERRRINNMRLDITRILDMDKKTLMDVEKGLLNIIVPIEQELKDKQDAIDEQKEKIKRKKKLPERIEKLNKILVETTEDFLLTMNDKDFALYFIQKKEEYLKKIEQKQKEAQEKIDANNAKMAREKSEKELKEKLFQEAKIKAEQDKQDALAEQARQFEQKEKDKMEAEKQKKKDDEEEQKKLEAKKKYQKWLSDNHYNKKDFFQRKEDHKIILYKKVSEFKL